MRTYSTPRLAVILAVAATLLASSVAAGAAGAALILGQSNSAGSSQTTLNATTSNPTLRVNNNGTGRALELEADALGPLRLIAPAGVPPFVTNSSTKVGNLNADRLDGLSSSAFLQASTINTFHSGPWVADPATDITISPLATGPTRISADVMGTHAAILYIPTPASIGGVTYAFSSVEFCTQAISINTSVDEVRVVAVDGTSATELVIDGTNHTLDGAQCFFYSDLTPEGGWAINLWIRWSFGGAGYVFDMRRVTVTWIAE